MCCSCTHRWCRDKSVIYNWMLFIFFISSLILLAMLAVLLKPNTDIGIVVVSLVCTGINIVFIFATMLANCCIQRQKQYSSYEKQYVTDGVNGVTNTFRDIRDPEDREDDDDLELELELTSSEKQQLTQLNEQQKLNTMTKPNPLKDQNGKQKKKKKTKTSDKETQHLTEQKRSETKLLAHVQFNLGETGSAGSAHSGTDTSKPDFSSTTAPIASMTVTNQTHTMTTAATTTTTAVADDGGLTSLAIMTDKGTGVPSA